MARGIETHNGKVVLGNIVSLEISKDFGAGKAIPGVARGSRIFMIDDEDTPCTFGDLYGLHILDMVRGAVAGESALLRLELNSTVAASRDSVINVPLSVLADIEYLFYVNPAHKTAWDSSGDKTSGDFAADGWLRCSIGGTERWIQLYKVA